MKSWRKLFFLLPALCLIQATDCAAASFEMESKRGAQKSGPMAEMILYEAAEQAVEDSYATIINEQPEDKNKTSDDIAETGSERKEQESMPSNEELLPQKK